MFNIKTMTKDDLIAYLSDEYQTRVEPDAIGNIIYYVHIDDDGNLVDFCTNDNITLTSRLCGVDDLPGNHENMQPVYDKETMDDPDFAGVVDDLWTQIQNLDI